MSDVLVFAPEPTLEVHSEEVEDVLVLRDLQPSTIQNEQGIGDFLLVDGYTITATVEVEADTLLVQGDRLVETVEAGVQREFTVLVTDPINPALPGPPGPPGLSLSFSFAVPSTLWRIRHDLAARVMTEAYDTNGHEIEGNVRYVDDNTVEIDWYYPTAGTARVFT